MGICYLMELWEWVFARYLTELWEWVLTSYGAMGVGICYLMELCQWVFAILWSYASGYLL